MVKMMTRVSSSAGSATILRVASRPSIPGIRMSIRTTSGRVAVTRVDRLLAVGSLAHDLDVVLRLEQRPQPRAQQCLVVGQHDADHDALLERQDGADRERRRSGDDSDRQAAAEDGGPLAHPAEPGTGSAHPVAVRVVVGHQIRADSVVVDLHRQLLGAVVEHDLGAGRAEHAGSRW